MSDSYQAVYDAVRSQVSRCSTGDVIERAAREAFDISFQKGHLQEAIHEVSHELQRPSAVFRPAVFPDGNMWCALYGANLQEGVCGFGETPEAACAAFDKAWRGQKEQREDAALAEAERKFKKLEGDYVAKLTEGEVLRQLVEHYECRAGQSAPARAVAEVNEEGDNR